MKIRERGKVVVLSMLALATLPMMMFSVGSGPQLPNLVVWIPYRKDVEVGVGRRFSWLMAKRFAVRFDTGK